MDPRELPHLFPPLDAIHFVMAGQVAVNSTGGFTVVDVPQISESSNNEGWVRTVGVRLSAYDLVNSFWRFALNGNGLRDWSQVYSPGPAPETPAEVVIKLEPNQELSFEVWNGTGGPIQATYWVKGHYVKVR